jgi:hypothetical protein
MGKKGGAPAPPDYSAIAASNKEAAEIQASVAREQLAWAKDQYAQDKEVTNKVVDRALQTQDVNDKNAAADRLRYEQKYQPLEDQAIADAQSYASPERKALEEGRAEATVADQFTQARNAATQNLEAFGVDPTSTRFAALDIGTRTQQAAAQAAAGNQAGQMVDATGRALRSEAINVGRGYPGQVAATYGTALQAGNQAVNSTLAQTTTGANTMGTAPQYYGLQSNFLNNWGNTLTQGYNAQLAQYNANQNSSSGWGSALGLFGGMAARGAMSYLAEGGAVDDPNVTPGGNVPAHASPSMGKAIDDVPANLTAGEFVVPKDVAAWKGEEFFQKLIQKSRTDSKGAQAKPRVALAAPQAPTFVSRPAGALPVR